MSTFEEAASYFEGEIERIVKEEEKQLCLEIEELRAETQKKVEANASQSVIQYKKQKEEDLQREIALSKSNIKQKYFKELSDQRNAIGNDVFNTVLKGIEDYTSSAAYKEELVAAIQEKYSDQVSIFVREEDSEHTSKLNTIVDPMIQLGGFIVKHKDSNKLEDKTIDTKFETQKTWFYENSGLEQI